MQAAGGLTAQADAARLNLAAPLADGQQVFVPAVGQPLPTAPPGDFAGLAAPPNPAPAGPINLNTATVEELETLPEIGPVTAAAIVAYRQEHGPFKTAEEVMEVRGIGPKTFEAIKGLITVDAP